MPEKAFGKVIKVERDRGFRCADHAAVRPSPFKVFA